MTENKGIKVLKDYSFYAEVLILLLMPYHFNNKMIMKFQIKTPNWFDYSGDATGTLIKETIYRPNDALLFLMLLRLYFVVLALFCTSPIENLHSRRVCFQQGFKPGFSFSFKANL